MNLDRQRLEELVNDKILHKHKKRTRIVNYIALTCGVLLAFMAVLEAVKKYNNKKATNKASVTQDQEGTS